MSDIDTGNHSYVGNFLKLPLYHPLNEFEMDCFEVNEKNFIIGGGSGEHPAMKIHSLEVAVISYLECLTELENYVTDDIFENANFQEWRKNQDMDDYPEMNLETDSAWTFNTIAYFNKTINKTFEKRIKQFHFNKDEKEECIAKLLNTDKRQDRYYSSEWKLHAMLGEFIFFSAKHLLDEQFQLFLSEIALEEQGYAQIPFDEVRICPKGYPCYGKYLSVKMEEGKEIIQAVWGLRFEDENSVKENVWKPKTKHFDNTKTVAFSKNV